MAKVPWSEIVEGDVVQSAKTGQVYRIERVHGTQFSLSRPDQTIVLNGPKGLVERLLSAQAVAERAIATVQVRLGGRVEAVKDDNDIYQVPVDYVEPGALLSHVYILHGRHLKESDFLPDMLKEHAELHKPDQKALGWVPHHHNPDFLKVINP